jgi:hypothetical protein
MANEARPYFDPGCSLPHQSACSVARELQLFDYLDRQLPPDQMPIVEAHLKECAHCRELSAHWRKLDAEFTEKLSPPSLSADFTARLRRRVAELSLDSVRIGQAKTRLQADFENNWAQVQRQFIRSRLISLLDFCGYGIAVALAAYLLTDFMVRILAPATTSMSATLNQFDPGLITGGGLIFVAISLGYVVRPRITSFLFT